EAPMGFLLKDEKDLRPADLLLFNWIPSKDACLDVTGISPFDGIGRLLGLLDKKPIHTLGDHSRPSHEGYRNTIELPEGNNEVPLQSDTIRGPYDTQYCMKNPEQDFVEYASSRTNEAGVGGREIHLSRGVSCSVTCGCVIKLFKNGLPQKINFTNHVVLLLSKLSSKARQLLRSKMSFHQALDLILELDETTVGCTRDIFRQMDCLNRLSEVPWVVPAFVIIEGK
nr:hypothetical protein [Tanacetum cinerariifolium]